MIELLRVSIIFIFTAATFSRGHLYGAYSSALLTQTPPDSNLEARWASSESNPELIAESGLKALENPGSICEFSSF